MNACKNYSKCYVSITCTWIFLYISLICDYFLCSYLLKVPNGKEPLKQFLVHIIFNAALWVKAKTNVSCFYSMYV